MKKIIIILLLLMPEYVKASFDNNLSYLNQSYKIFLEGLYIGNLKGNILKQEDNLFKITTNIKTKGLFSTINYHINAKSLFAIEDNEIKPINFTLNSEEYKRKRDINLNFVNKKILDESNIPPENRFKRPAINNDLKQDILDPLAAAIFIYQNIYNGTDNDFSFKIYEGRRLSYLDIYDIKDIKNIKSFKLRRVPIAGYTTKELSKIREKSPEVIIHLNKANNLLPIYASFKTEYGNVELKI